jgi:hypothetical protein
MEASGQLHAPAILLIWIEYRNRFYSINQKDNESKVNIGKGVTAYITKCNHPPVNILQIQSQYKLLLYMKV